MENKPPAPQQNIQDIYLNTMRRDKIPVTIFLIGGVRLVGKIRGFDKYSAEKSRVKQLPELRYLIDSMEFFPPQIPVAKTPSFMNMNEMEERKADTTDRK